MKTYRLGATTYDWVTLRRKLFFTLFLLVGLCFDAVTQVQRSSFLSSAVASANNSPPALGTNGKIALVKYFDDQTSDIFVMNPDGTNQLNITNDRNPDSSPAWSPDGSKIAFAKYVQSVDGWNIYVMNTDGSNLRQITFNRRVFDLNINDPAWSPDGKKIALVTTLHGVLSSLIVMNADGSEPRVISQGWYYVRPAWSPDGTRIAFVGSLILAAGAAGELTNCAFVINADGSGKTCVANNSWPFSGPVWSPDGTKLLYSRVENANDPHRSIANLYMVNAAGGTPTQLTDTRVYDTDPVWSPDGTMITFGTTRNKIMCLPGAAPCREIYLMNADGSNQRRIANEPILGYVSDWQSLTPKVVLPLASPTLQFNAWRYRLPEAGGGVEKIMVTRLGDLSGEASVEYATSDGTASAGSDYLSTSGSLKFAAGEGEKTITIPLLNDSLVEGSETVNLSLRNAQGASFGASSTAILTIVDDDLLIDDAQFFVRQHYLDFLNREPDPPGLAFWTDNITKCNDPARRSNGQTEEQCLDKQRLTTSAAFFLSPEFQYTGYFVYRFYKGALTGVLNYDGGSPGRFPFYSEFIRDVRQVAAGIVVNNKLSAERIEANRAAFAEQFVGRIGLEAYTNQQYVDRLFQITTITPTAAERQALIDGLNNNTESRATVLRKVVDGTRVLAEGQEEFQTRYGKAFYDQEFNRAFVLMEYFGYLRRDPDTPGYNHWLGKLNLYGNYIDAEMVRSFLVSPEYRSRFGQP